MAFVDTPWDGSEGRFTIEQWKSSCLIDTGEGDPGTKQRYKLPVKEPNGDYNKAAIRNARARISQVEASPASKKKAQARLDALAKQASIGQ